MRRHCSRTLTAFIIVGLTGCSYVPSFPKVSFPDLWPFNDEPVVSSKSNAAPTAGAETVGAPPVETSVAVPVQAPVETAEVPNQPATAQQAALTPSQAAPAVTRAPAVAPLVNGGASASTPGAIVYIISPANGAVVTNPVKVLFGLDRMGIAPVSSSDSGTGHHHLLVDTPLPAQLDRAIPVDEKHLHFSGGQTETSLNLPVGQHTLQLLLGDHTHTPHQPAVMSRQITITVQ